MFWNEYTEFGEFMLNKLYDSDDKLDLKNRWDEVSNVFKRYFPTQKEYEQIVVNVAFIKGEAENLAKEDLIFMMYAFLRQHLEDISISEIMNMDLKTFLKLYLYLIGDRYTVFRKKGEYHG